MELSTREEINQVLKELKDVCSSIDPNELKIISELGKTILQRLSTLEAEVSMLKSNINHLERCRLMSY